MYPNYHNLDFYNFSDLLAFIPDLITKDRFLVCFIQFSILNSHTNDLDLRTLTPIKIITDDNISDILTLFSDKHDSLTLTEDIIIESYI